MQFARRGVFALAGLLLGIPAARVGKLALAAAGLVFGQGRKNYASLNAANSQKEKFMLKDKLLLLVIAATLGIPLSAGTILDTYPDGPSGYTNGYVLQAQTFTVGADTVLSSFQFQMFNAPGEFVQLEIFAWGPSGPTGPVLGNSAVLQRFNNVQDYLVSGLNLTLTQGSLYGAVIFNNGYTGESAAYNTNQTSYTGGNMWLVSQDTPSVWSNFPSDNLLFKANFVANASGPSGTPEPAALLLTGTGLAIVGVLKFRGRQ